MPARTNTIETEVGNDAGRDDFPVDANLLLNSTWHALSGVSMQTVCDLEVRIFGHQGLYVLDSTLMPAPRQHVIRL